MTTVVSMQPLASEQQVAAAAAGFVSEGRSFCAAQSAVPVRLRLLLSPPPRQLLQGKGAGDGRWWDVAERREAVAFAAPFVRNREHEAV